MIPEETQGATKVADAIHEHRPVSSELVRGARPGSRILLLLIASAGAAAVLLLGMWAVSKGGFASQNPDSDQNAAAFNDDAPVGPATPSGAASRTGAPPPAQPIAAGPSGAAPDVNVQSRPVAPSRPADSPDEFTGQ